MEAQIKSKRDRLLGLYQISYEQSLGGNAALLAQELATDRDASQFYIRWLKLYAQYIGAVFNGASTVETVRELKKLLSDLNSATSTSAVEKIRTRLSLFLDRGK